MPVLPTTDKVPKVPRSVATLIAPVGEGVVRVKEVTRRVQKTVQGACKAVQ